MLEPLWGWPPPVLDPAGPYAGSVAVLTWVLVAVGAAVLLLVAAALWIAFFGKARTRRRRARPPPLHGITPRPKDARTTHYRCYRMV